MKTFSLIAERQHTSTQQNTKTLNPKLWTEDKETKPDVRKDILRLTTMYANELGLNKNDVEQVNAVGGNASYDWHPNGDLDITLVLVPNAEMSRKRFKSLANSARY